MRARLGNVRGLLGTGPDGRELYTDPGREKLSKDPSRKFAIEPGGSEDSELCLHEDAETERRYIEEYVLVPIEKAGNAAFQTDLDRWSHVLKDSLSQIDSRLGERKILLYRTLRRLDHTRPDAVTDIVREREEAFLELGDAENPCHLVFRRPQQLS